MLVLPVDFPCIDLHKKLKTLEPRQQKMKNHAKKGDIGHRNIYIFGRHHNCNTDGYENCPDYSETTNNPFGCKNWLPSFQLLLFKRRI